MLRILSRVDGARRAGRDLLKLFSESGLKDRSQTKAS